MREVHIAMCLIRQEDHYLLQHRLGDAMIGAAGLIGCFGGKIEDNETPEQAVCRELYEETNIQVNSEDVEELGVVEVVSDHKNEPVSVIANVFSTVIDKNFKAVAKEGAMISVPVTRFKEYIVNMTPATKVCFEQLVKE